MVTQMQLGDIAVDVVLKDIKNIHLGVYPPNGRVRISAPRRMSLDTIRVFVMSKLPWIKKQQARIREQERETPREYLDRESHYVWGKRYLLVVVESNAAPSIALNHERLILSVRPGTDEEKKREIVEAWYRDHLRKAVPPLIAKWEGLIGVKVERFLVRRMRTRWGSCSTSNRRIRLNTDLAKKPPECLEFVLVHEMIHLVEPTHNARFVSLLDRFMPNWQLRRDQLNQLPVRHEEWRY